MSRFGRNYISVGIYTEELLPDYNVRFIAMHDGVDSLYESANQFTPMRNWINELYAKDCSKKFVLLIELKPKVVQELAHDHLLTT